MTQEQCVVQNCDKPRRPVRRGLAFDRYCAMHRARLTRHGNVDIVLLPEQRKQWTGDNATYRAVHKRLATRRGRASEYDCIDCGDQAESWSLQPGTENLRHEPGTGNPYSTDVSDYAPRCWSCHIKVDKHESENAGLPGLLESSTGI